MSHRLERLAVGVLLTALAAVTVALGAAAPPPAAAAGESVFQNFITRDVDRLMDGPQEYRFLSAATPTLGIVEDNFPFADRPDFEWRWPDAYEIRDTLETIRQMGGQATRIYCLSVLRSQDRPGTPRHIVAPASLPDGSVNDDAFNEEGFRTLDRILATANELGVRVVIPFTNQYPWHGGYTDLAALRGIPSYQFWTNASLRADFKAIVNYVLNRVNTITGVAYKDDKAILAWSYGNELNSATSAWVTEMGSYIRSLDPNHLIMLHTTTSSISTTQRTNPYVDIAATSVYDNFQNISVARITNQRNQVRGIKPYTTFEFGFASTSTLGAIMDTIISTGTSGGQLWGLRPHNPEGGFYWHGESSSGPMYLLRSYHWPGFPSGDRYDESTVMSLLRTKAFEIRGLPAPPLEAPAAPTLLPIDSPTAISWQGSTGARSYVLERAAAADGPWTVVNGEVYDDVAYTPVYDDSSTAIGGQYFYRVSARNEAGVSPPSNVVGPVLASSHLLVDDTADFSKTADHSAGLTIEQRNNRTVLERLSRVVRTTATPGEFVTYELNGTPNWFKAFTFFQAAGTDDFAFAFSRDGVGWTPLQPVVSRYGEGPGTYGYWYRVLYSDAVPPDARFLRIEFPNLTTAASPALSRVEIDYDAAPAAAAGDTVTGGAHRTVGASAGTYAASPGSMLQASFNAMAKKSLQGQANVIFVSGDRTYQAKGTGLDSFRLARAAGGDRADLGFAAKLVDVTDPDAPVAIADGLTLRITVTDRGEPGTGDALGVALWDSGTLLLSSDETQLDGGNVVVH